MAGTDDSMDLELTAASLRADASDVGLLMKVLADSLADALGPRLEVKRSGGRFRKSDDVRSLRIGLGDDLFEAEVEGGSVRCTIGHSSGGIRIRSEKVGLDPWLTRLVESLKAEAANSLAVRQALETIVIGGNHE
ncbi:MAG TPA: hypothetical protein VG032_12150 [Acidimicrobiales bacterium]|jgi:hypothetical protein|nr:hypothetical protein [Acidimicrobiales bacterium]